MAELRTTDSTIDELLQGIEALSPRAQRHVLRLAEGTEKIGRKTDFTRPATQEWLAARLVHKARAIAYQDAAAGLFEDVSAVGITVEEVPDLERDGVGDTRALEPLIRWLRLTDNRTLKIHIVGALGAAWAGRRGIDALLEEFGRLSERNDPDPNSVRAHITSELRNHAVEVGRDRLAEIALRPSNGQARQSAIEGLGKLTKQKAELIPLILEFLNTDDSDLYLPAAQVLSKWNVAGARERLQVLIDTADERYAVDPIRTFKPDFERDEMRKALWKISPVVAPDD